MYGSDWVFIGIQICASLNWAEEQLHSSGEPEVVWVCFGAELLLPWGWCSLTEASQSCLCLFGEKFLHSVAAAVWVQFLLLALWAASWCSLRKSTFPKENPHLTEQLVENYFSALLMRWQSVFSFLLPCLGLNCCFLKNCPNNQSKLCLLIKFLTSVCSG